MRTILLYVSFLILIALYTYKAVAGQLDVTRVGQETHAWCWLASSEMVLTYHGACKLNKDPTSMQCSMIKNMALEGFMPKECLADCYACPFPAKTATNMRLAVDLYTRSSKDGCPKLETSIYYDSLSLSNLKSEIDHKRPVMVGINPSLNGKNGAEAEHLVVAVGYEGDTIRINDPYRYVFRDPYLTVGAKKLSEGVYDVDYKILVKDFGWQNTITTEVKHVRKD